MDLNPSKKSRVANDSFLLGQDTHFVLQSAFGFANPALSADKVGGSPLAARGSFTRLGLP
jgi:hypothetical protein